MAAPVIIDETNWISNTSQEWLDICASWHYDKFTCIRCDKVFTERANMGQWKCRYHSHSFNAEKNGINFKRGRWDCCNKPLIMASNHHNGCVVGDHVTYWHLRPDIKVIDKYVVLYFLRPQPKEESFFTPSSTSPLYKDIKTSYFIQREGPLFNESIEYPYDDLNKQ